MGVVKFGGEYYCITEAPFLHKIDPVTLETISKVGLGAPDLTQLDLTKSSYFCDYTIETIPSPDHAQPDVTKSCLYSGDSVPL